MALKSILAFPLSKKFEGAYKIAPFFTKQLFLFFIFCGRAWEQVEKAIQTDSAQRRENFSTGKPFNLKTIGKVIFWTNENMKPLILNLILVTRPRLAAINQGFVGDGAFDNLRAKRQGRSAASDKIKNHRFGKFFWTPSLHFFRGMLSLEEYWQSLFSLGMVNLLNSGHPIKRFPTATIAYFIGIIRL